MGQSGAVGAVAVRTKVLVSAAAAVLIFSTALLAQTLPAERTFTQNKAAVENALKKLPISGRLPMLDGFAVPGEHPLSHYQHGYYQCEIKVTGSTSGGATVRVSAKITAWYPDPAAAGYQVLSSNGRLENDLLDQLQDALGAGSAQKITAETAASKAKTSAVPPATISAPTPNAGELSDAISSSHTSATSVTTPYSSRAHGDVPSSRTQTAAGDKHLEELRTEAQNLEEILRTQVHPKNLVAVKNPDTPVLASPDEGAKLLFSASAGDEFEILDMNANWVHVRISGLSRGWLRRSSVEVLNFDAAADNATQVADEQPGDTEKKPAGEPFQVENEQIASFPGDWEPLRGKTVKIISVQEPNGKGPGTDAPAKLQFAKKLLGKEYSELAHDTDTAGLVLIFDAEDGGMMAATRPVLQQWKAGDLSDEALWRRCYFDPPEMSGKLASP